MIERYKSIVGLYVVSAVILTMVGCGRSDFEEQAKSKKLNTVRRAQYTDKQWADLFAGKVVYERYCSGCHGLKGDGKGTAVSMLAVQPRNFQRAMFKFISTPSGSLPTDADLHRTLLRGIPRSSMPSWAMLTEEERVLVIGYIKTFSSRWQEEPAVQPVSFGEPPQWIGSLNSVVLGKGVYARMGCMNCHGELGKGDGMSSANLTDAEGNKILPFNFTEGILKGGATVKDIYRTFYTGLAGTPMPAFGGILTDDDNWHLVSYVVYLMGKTRWTDAEVSNALAHMQIDSTRNKPVAAK